MPSPTLPGGLLIAIDGIDGAGKTTLAESIARKLFDSYGVEVIVSKEPTRGKWGSALRESAKLGRLTPQMELEYLELDRREHVAEVIEPALSAGHVVILDRYYFSTVAYQGSEGLPPATILAQNKSYAPTPHLALILDLPVDQALGRIAARGDQPNHFERTDTLEACRNLFRWAVEQSPEARLIDASPDADAVLETCWNLVTQAIILRVHRAAGLTKESVATLAVFTAAPEHRAAVAKLVAQR